jgi:putative Mn2+ efflux pump MntP
MLDADLVVSIVAIGVITAGLSAAGVLTGRRLGAALGRRLEVAGGVALILIGLKAALT